MPRNSSETDEYRRTSNRGTGRRASWLKRLVVASAIVLLLAIAFAPRLLIHASFINTAVHQMGVLSPLKLEIGQISAGWLSPASVANLRLLDEGGNEIAKVKSITTDKGLLGWIGNRQDLGVISIDGVEATLNVSNGSTSLEQALAGVLPESAEESADSSSTALPLGTLSLTNVKLMLAEQGRAERWIIDIPSFRAVLPTENQLIGPIELKAIVSESSGTLSSAPGEIIAKAEQTADGAVELRAKLDNLALDLWHVVKARLPSIPIDAMTGLASGVLAGNAVDLEQWTFDLQQVQVQNFAMSAPELIGPSPARLNSIVAGGRVSLANKLMQLQETQLICDVGNLQAAASLPWPLQIPSLSAPFQQGAVLQATGSVDLPKLALAAQSLIPVREGTQLLAGKMQFSANHQPQGSKLSQVQVTFTGLQALASGQQISWNDPLTIQMTADQQQQPNTQFGLAASAEFCNVQGKGTLEQGSLNGDVNLQLLHQRLSQFIQLPIDTMSGAAKLDLQWNMDQQQQVQAVGKLETTPLVIATSTGGQMREPSWRGEISASAQLRDGSPQRLNKLNVNLLADKEQLTLELFEPVSLVTGEGATALPPAAFQLAVTGDLSNWKRRGLVWLNEPPDIDASGNIKLAVSGKVDLQHAEVWQANWDAEPVGFRMSDIALAEPKMIGNFKGRIDTSDLTRSQVDQLTIQANSFWIVAQDQAASGSDDRSGQANFMLDLERFMSNLAAAQKASVWPAAVASQYSATGSLQGNLQWLIGTRGADFAIQAKGENLVALSQAAQIAPPEQLWSEPSLDLGLNGKWISETGAMDLSALQLQTPWMNYKGNLAYRSTEQAQDLTIQGQAVYDAAQLALKLGSMTGSQIQMEGKQSAPVQVHWHRDANLAATTPALAGLKASTRLGWEQARVVGIEVGKADVPITIDAGKFTTAAEIPVSGGMLRWDIFSDLTSDLFVIEQKPMVVLENVAITPEMCSGWLKYVAPLLAETTSVDGRLSLAIDRALLTPTDLAKQTVEGKLVMHQAEVGPGPLTNEISGLIRQFEAIRKADPIQTASNQNRVWMKLPQQQIAFRMVEGKVYHRDLNIALGDASITTAGSVDVAGNLELVASLPIPEAWTQRGPVLAALRGQTLQFPMRGTIYRPQLDSSTLAQLGQQTIQNAAQGLLQQGLNRGLEKLFK